MSGLCRGQVSVFANGVWRRTEVPKRRDQIIFANLSVTIGINQRKRLAKLLYPVTRRRQSSPSHPPDG